MGNLCGRPKPKPERALTTEETKLINNLTKIDDFNEMLAGTVSNYMDDPIFLAKIVILIGNNKFSDPTFISEFKNEYTAKITNEVRNGRFTASNISSIEDLQAIVAPIIKEVLLSKSTNNFTRDEAIYFVSLAQTVGDTLENYGDSNNRPSNFFTTFINKCYELSKENPRKPMADAVTNAVNHITTTFSLTLNPVVEDFQNKNSFIMKELKKQLNLISNMTTEPFKNKKVKEKTFSGYSLESSALLPKDYADF